MPSTFSPLKIELIATGEQSGTWGVTTNTNLGTAIEEAITGSADVTFTNGNDTTITLTDVNTTQAARNLRLNLVGSSTGAQNLILGSGCQIEKLYLINNTLGHTITVKNTTGTGIAVPAGKTMFVYNNGTNVVDAITHLTSLSTGAITSTQVNITGQGDLRLEDTTGGEYVALQAPASLASSYTLTMPVDDGTNGQALITDGNGNLSWSTAASGDVYGPASSTLNAIPTFADTTGKLIQNNSGVTISSNTVTASGGFSTAANLAFTGAGNRITGDFSNATIANRVMFQNSITNSGTVVGAIPNGSGTEARYSLFNSSDTANTSTFDIRCFSEVQLRASQVGTGSLLPITIYTGGSERLRIDTSGNVGIGTTSPATKIEIANGKLQVNTGGVLGFAGTGGINLYTGAGAEIRLYDDSNSCGINTVASGGASSLAFSTSGTTERMRIDASGNVGIGTSTPSTGTLNRQLTINSGASSLAGIVLQNNATGTAFNDGFQIYLNGTTGTFSLVENSPMTFEVNGSERMRIGSTGFVGIGTSNPGVQFQVNSTSEWGITLRAASNTTTFRCLPLTQRALGSLASPLTVTAGTIIGGLEAGAYNGSAYTFGFNGGAAIQIQAEDTWTTTSCPTNIVFYTNPTGQAGYIERMRLNADGSIRMNCNGAAISHGFSFNENGGEINLYDEASQLATLLDQSSNQTRLLELINGSNMVVGTGAANTTGVVQFVTQNAERMRITSGGAVGIGISSPSGTLDVVGGAAGGNTNPVSGTLVLRRNGGPAAGDYGPGITFAQYWFSGSTDLVGTGQISGVKTSGSGNFGGGLAFFSCPEGSSTFSERMRIIGNGNLLVGDTGQFANGGRLHVRGTDQIAADFYRANSGASNTTITRWVNADGGGTVIASITTSGALTISGALSKGSGSFRIDHPLPQLNKTHQLVHSFVEAPQADNIYRGKVALVNGRAEVNIDQKAGMTEGTFVALNRDVQCFTSNETDWDAVRGSVVENILTIECQNQNSTAIISWLVIGERQDKHMYETDWTDENGKVIVEPLKKTSND